MHVKRRHQYRPAAGSTHLQQAPPIGENAIGRVLSDWKAIVLHSTPAGCRAGWIQHTYSKVHCRSGLQDAVKQTRTAAANTQQKAPPLHLIRAGVTAWPSALSADSSNARPPQAQGEAMLVPAAAISAGRRSWVGKITGSCRARLRAHLLMLVIHPPTHRSSTGAAAGSIAARGQWRRRALHGRAIESGKSAVRTGSTCIHT